ncbi:MAG: YXWGXW repeat-containing protein [Rhodanobacteraceae bacterium]
MHIRNLALLGALAMAGGATMGFTPPASAQVGFSISVGRRPPPPRYEVVPAARPGYVWAPGYWNWSGRQYIWVRGAWYRGRPGYMYHRPQWVHHGNRWEMRRAYWGRDPHWRGRRDHGHHKHDGDHQHQ